MSDKLRKKTRPSTSQNVNLNMLVFVLRLTIHSLDLSSRRCSSYPFLGERVTPVSKMCSSSWDGNNFLFPLSRFDLTFFNFKSYKRDQQQNQANRSKWVHIVIGVKLIYYVDINDIFSRFSVRVKQGVSLDRALNHTRWWIHQKSYVNDRRHNRKNRKGLCWSFRYLSRRVCVCLWGGVVWRADTFLHIHSRLGSVWPSGF